MTSDAGKRIEFDRDEQYENEGPLKGPWFRKGEQYDFTEDFADRWLRRDAAHEVRVTGKTTFVGTAGPFVPVKGAKADKAETKAADKPAPSKVADTKTSKPAPETDVAFAALDIVVLKSGGPEMLVEGVADDGTVTATWKNDDGTDSKAEFAPDLLEKVLPKAPEGAAPQPGFRAPPKPGEQG